MGIFELHSSVILHSSNCFIYISRPFDYLPKLQKINSLKSSFRNFNRFSMSTEERNNLEVSPSVGFIDTVTMSELSRGFDNPMYSEPGATVSISGT